MTTTLRTLGLIPTRISARNRDKSGAAFTRFRIRAAPAQTAVARSAVFDLRDKLRKTIRRVSAQHA